MNKKSDIWDVIVVGAGPAGLMTAVQCARQKLRVLLLDGQAKIGAKILMSGGTRCNLTNQDITENDYNSHSSKYVRNILRAFPTDKTILFFKSIGVKTLVDERGQYYPTTNESKTVLDAFLNALDISGVTLLNQQKVKKILFDNNTFTVFANDEFYAPRVVLTTGGLSFPQTGSDGVGYTLAKHFGHTVLPTFAALTPFITDDRDWRAISGVSLPCRLTLFVEGKKSVQFENDLLFTHFGFSGLGVLNISRHWEANRKNKVQVIANFLPNTNMDEFRKDFDLYTKQFPKRQLKTFLLEKFPERFVDVLLLKNKIDATILLNQCKREDRERLFKMIFEYPMPIKSVYGYGKSEVTAGGVDLKEVDDKTLESKKQPGLYFAGEILDVDGRIGGYNFQWAWASGFAVAQGIARKND